MFEPSIKNELEVSEEDFVLTKAKIRDFFSILIDIDQNNYKKIDEIYMETEELLMMSMTGLIRTSAIS